jgi:hypothetical protein
MKQLTVFLATLLGLTVSCSVAYPSRKPAARVSKISFFVKHRAPEQHRDRISHERR